jgi:putative transposase
LKVSIDLLCRKVIMSRQNYYKAHQRRRRKEVDDELVEKLVKVERASQPRLGGRKLYFMLKPELEDAGVSIGRDLFFEVLRTNNLLLGPLPRSPRTTNSRHSLPVFRNIIKGREITGPNQVWVSDITYIRTIEGFLYLSLITDKYSRKIVGYNLGGTLETEESLKALEMALKRKPKGGHIIHHSDRGCQYCSHLYVDKLEENGFEISMTEESHCSENALAERVNGILKQEYWLGSTFRSKEQVHRAVEEAIHLYNTRRPHTSLNYKTPEHVHRMAA